MTANEAAFWAFQFKDLLNLMMLIATVFAIVWGPIKAVQITKEGERHHFGTEELLCDALNLCRGDGFDLVGDLVDATEAAKVHLLARKICHAAARAFEAENDVALELVFGALQLCLTDCVFFETAEFIEGEPEDSLRLVDRGAGVDAE